MGTYTTNLNLYKPTLGETGWDNEVNDSTDILAARISELALNVKAAPFLAVGDGVADDTAAIQAAYAAGRNLFFPAGSYKVTGTLVVPSHSVWIGAGNMRYDQTTNGTRILYTGTGTAVDLTGKFNATLMSMRIHCSSTSATAVKLGDPSTANTVLNVTISGAGTGGGTGILFSGQTSCSCGNAFKSVTVENFQRCIRLSGFANGNDFSIMQLQTCSVAIDFTALGPDTEGGDDNVFKRVEINGGTDTGIILASTASRNLFLKTHMDGTTAGGTVASGCLSNTFINTHLTPTWVDSQTAVEASVYINCTGTAALYTKAFVMGPDASLFRTGVGALGTDASFTTAAGKHMQSGGEVYARLTDATQVKFGYFGGFPGITFGNGEDTVLYRSAANTLMTDDTFRAVLGLGTNHVAAATPTGGVSGDIKIGDGKIWVNDAGTWKSVAVA